MNYSVWLPLGMLTVSGFYTHTHICRAISYTHICISVKTFRQGHWDSKGILRSILSGNLLPSDVLSLYV